MAGVPVYRGRFGPAQAERLLWRAGFGPRPGEATRLAHRGLRGAVLSLTRPGRERLRGYAPVADGRPLAPSDAYGHDHLWWLDRMVRTSRPLVERMTLVWHDWFATSNAGVGSQRLMLRQNRLFRSHALGNFQGLLLDVTKDAAMLLWLSGNQNNRYSPNENYARELMELFTLGADRPGGYTEDDVREQARALTGWRNDWSDTGPYNFRLDPSLHDYGDKVVFGRRGNFDWQDACRLCVRHPNHPSFFVRKLWSYFVPTDPDAATQAALERLYVGSKHAVRPVVEAILRHPDLYEGPRMVKPPIVYTAGLLRALATGVETADWVWIGWLTGQQLFYPPNVAGWDDRRWLDTATFRGRWLAASRALEWVTVDEATGGARVPTAPDRILAKALLKSGRPSLRGDTRRLLLEFVQGALDADAGRDATTRPMVFNAVCMLAAVSPDRQTC